jgi:hypothetical protein
LTREDIEWARVEPEPGRFDWRVPDAIFSAAARVGIGVLPILDTPPGWAGPPDDSDAIPTRPAAYARYVAGAAARYGPGGRFWRVHPAWAHLAPTWFELLNEPYLHTDPNPVAYARLVARAVPAGRRANPRARFLVAADLTTEGAPPIPWLEALYSAVPGFARFVDGVAVHPYGLGDPRVLDAANARHEVRRVELVRAGMVANGSGRAPIWITEVGWPTCPLRPTCVSEAQQAANLRATLTLARTRWRPYVRALVIYTLQDFDRQRPSEPVGWFGLLRADGTPKPAWQVLRRYDRARARRSSRRERSGA